MKYIVIDLFSAQPEGGVKFHGGGEYIKTIFKAFSQKHLTRSEETVVLCYDEKAFLDDWILEIIEEKAYCVKNVNSLCGVIEIVNDLALIGEVRFFAGLPYHYEPFSLPSNVVTIGTLHGLRAVEKQTDKYLFKYYSGFPLVKEMVKKVLKKPLSRKYYSLYKKTIKNFDVIITDSQHSAYSLRVNYPNEINNKDIRVFYPLTQEIVDLHLNYWASHEQEKYIMVVSANRWIKNSYRGLKAIDNLFSKKLLKGVSVKVYGKAPKKIQNSLINKDCFTFFDYVSSDELEEAYKECEVLFYPTLNEGFGNVPMEAMKYAKTCVVSAVCSLPEIYEDTVYWCNPYDIMEMENRILQAVEHRIDEKRIIERLNELYQRQREDLDKMLQLISGNKKESE